MNFAIEKLLPPPKLVQLGTVQWVRARQRIVALYAASLSICVFTVELQKLDAEAAAWPANKLLRIKASSDNKEPIEAPLARIGAAGKQAICISNPNASQENSCVSRQAS